MAFTELFCRSGGSNLNGGGLSTGAEPPTAAAYTSTNGNFDGTSVFTPVDGSTPASTVTVGDFASVFLDAASVAVYVARVTAVAAGVNGAITLSTTAKSGTAPASGATGRTIKVGGAWKGPNAAEKFPFGFITNALVNVAGDGARVNLKNDATYSITASLLHDKTGPIRFQGYTTTADDLGKAIIDGGTSGVSYSLVNFTSAVIGGVVCDLEIRNNGATSNFDGIDFDSGNNGNIALRCVVHDLRGSGIFLNNGGGNAAIECEAYNCNQSNSVGQGGFQSGWLQCVRCISHDNTGSNNCGFTTNSYAILINCIAESNGSHGVSLTTTGSVGLIFQGCDFYNNGGDGVRLANTGSAFFVIENCNFVKNGGYGINGSGSGARVGSLKNCGFGSGTQANTSGATTSLKSMAESGTITYASGVTPWVDPANGDFRINLAAAKGTGRGTFTQTQGSYAGTVGYPDVGSAQHRDAPRARTLIGI